MGSIAAVVRSPEAFVGEGLLGGKEEHRCHNLFLQKRSLKVFLNSVRNLVRFRDC